MAKYRVTGPDGQTYEVNAPEGASEQDVMAYVHKNAGQAADPFAGQEVRRSPLEDVVGYLNKGAQAVASGAAGGYMDEIAAGLDSPFVAGKRALVDGQPFDMGKAYDDRLAGYRKDREQFAEEYPVSSFVGEVGGAIASPATKAVMGATAAKAGAGLLPRMGKAALGGGALGGVYGSGNAEGGWENRLSQGLAGAGVGAGTGGLLVPVVDGVVAAARPVVARILNQFGNTDKGQRKAVEAIARGNGGDIKAAVETVRKALAESGDDVAIADVGGINAQRMARAAANVPGKSTQIADDFVANRMAGRAGRMEKAADNLAPNRFYESLDELSAAQRGKAGPLYDEAFAPVSDKAGKVFAQWDDRLQQFLDDPIVQQGMNKGIRIQQLEALAEGRPFNFQEYAVKGFDDAGKVIIEGTPNLRAMDAAKRGMDDILEGYRDPVTGKLNLDEMGRAINSVRKSLVAKLDDITTDSVTGRSAYKEARAAYAGPAAIKDATWMGRRFLRGDEEITRKTFANMTPAEQEAFQFGVRRELSKTIQSDTQSAPGKFAGKKADLWTRLEAIFPPERFAAFKRDIGLEQQKMQTERMVGPRAGSHTTPMKQDIDELSRMPSWALESLQGARQGDSLAGKTLGMLGPAIKAPFQALTRPSEKTATSLADILLTTDRARQTGFLNDAVATPAANLWANVTPEARRKLATMITSGGLASGTR